MYSNIIQTAKDNFEFIKELPFTFVANGASLSATSSSCYIYNAETNCNLALPTITRSGFYIDLWTVYYDKDMNYIGNHYYGNPTPTDKKIEYGDFVTMDFGAVYNGYHSDMTRTVAVGEISKEMEDVYNIVLLAHEKGRDALRPGASCKEVDAIARKVIEDGGYGEYFTHSLGHGVGIEIHESPRLSKTSEDVLKVGDVVTVEPGIYIENKFGVRIENMYVITRDGYENLTISDKKLINL